MFRWPFQSKSLAQKEAQGSSLLAEPIPDPHLVEAEQFKEVLESFGATRIEDRMTILDFFLSTEHHITISELVSMVSEKSPHLADGDFLLETMEMFCRFGFAQEITFESHETRYEHHHLGTHHDHFICTRCGRIQEFSNPNLEHLQLAITRDYGFHPLQHKMEIYGLCAPCMGQRDQTISLPMAMKGEIVRIVQVTGGREMQAKLASMGLILDACLEVLSDRDSGPFLVALKGTRMALGEDICQNILVAHSCRHEELERKKTGR